MLLEPEEADQFHNLYQPLLAFAAARLGSVAGVSDVRFPVDPFPLTSCFRFLALLPHGNLTSDTCPGLSPVG